MKTFSRFLLLSGFLLVTFFENVNAITLSTYNIRNYNYDSRSRVATNEAELSSIIKAQNADLIAVQEINEPEIFTLFVHQNLPGYDVILTQCGGSLRQKLGFVYKKKRLKLLSFSEDQRFSRSDYRPDPNGEFRCVSGGRPVAIAKFKRVNKNFKFWALGVHLKAGGSRKAYAKRKAQIELLGKTITQMTSESEVKAAVIMGDFNTTHYSQRGERYQHFVNFVQSNDLRDETEELACSAYWWGGVADGFEHPSLLDHIIVNKAFKRKHKNKLLKKVHPQVQASAHCARIQCNLGSPEELGLSYQEVSDHCPVVVRY